MTVEMALPRTGIFCILQMTNGPVGDRHLTKALTERQDILISLVKNYLHTRMVPGGPAWTERLPVRFEWLAAA